jgi:hypothetical protein
MKKQGWENMLAEYIEEATKKEFKWGKHDCFFWVCDWKTKATGINELDNRKDFEDKGGEYNTKIGAARRLKELIEENDLSKLIDSRLEKIPLARAMRGDIMMINGALGICDGENSFFLTPDKGLILWKTSKCDKAWRLE